MHVCDILHEGFPDDVKGVTQGIVRAKEKRTIDLDTIFKHSATYGVF